MVIKVNVLIIATQIGDEIIGCGGTLAKHVARGDQVYVCILCKNPNVFPSENNINTFEKQIRSVHNSMKVRHTFLHQFKLMELNTEPRINIVRAISSVIEKIKPNIVYTSNSGGNPDHRIVFEATIAATRPIGKHIVKKVLCYEIPLFSSLNSSDSDSAFLPNVFVDISNDFDKKIKAFNQYNKKINIFQKEVSTEFLKLNASVYGIRISVKFVEAFELIREII